MEVRFYEDAIEFQRLVAPALLADESLNSLPLGILAALADQSRRGQVDPALRADPVLPPVLAAAEHSSGAFAAMIQTPPRALLLSWVRIECVPSMADALLDRGIRPPGVVGPSACVPEFAEAIRVRTGAGVHVRRSQRLYELRAVQPPRPCPGRFDVANGDDAGALAEWTTSFFREIDEPMPADALAMARGAIADGSLHVWRDGPLVATAGLTRRLPTTASVNRVYTPPALRGRGYASNLVAALSQMILDGGRRSALLFTDLANPVSNSIYSRIGYRPVWDFDEIAFDWPATGQSASGPP